jgi:hypothetical protein
VELVSGGWMIPELRETPESKRRAKFQIPQFSARSPRQPKPAKRKNPFSNSFRLAISNALV